MNASSRWRRMPRILMAAAGLALVASLGAGALADSPNTTFYGCLNTFTGALVRVNTQRPPACGWAEQPVQWSQTGPQGATGPAGPQGASAYQTWLAQQGNEEGTEQGFLDSLKGDTGDTGAAGQSAFALWQAQAGNENKTEAEFLESLRGPQGNPGPAGTNGTNGQKGDDGASAFEIWQAQAGNENKTEDDFFAFLKGATGATGPQGPQGIPGISGYELVDGPQTTFTAGTQGFANASCPDGKLPIGGGGVVSSAQAVVIESFPVANGWNSFVKAGSEDTTAHTRVICAYVTVQQSP